MTTRSSARLSQKPLKNDSSQYISRIRTRRQSSSDIIIIHSDNESVEMNKPKTKFSTPRKEKSRTSDFDINQISPVTPPKQLKTNCDSHTPQSKKREVHTPSTLLNKLVISIPFSEHLSGNNELRPSRKSLFKENNKEDLTFEVEQENSKNGVEELVWKGKKAVKDNNKNVNTESDKSINQSSLERRVVSKKLKNPNVYQNARKALHSTFPTDMPGREEELDSLRTFIKEHVHSRSSGSLYVSGPPGTGKTASLNLILQEDNVSTEFDKVYVNCTAIKSPTSIYSRIFKELGIKVKNKTEKDYLAGIESYLKRKHKMILLVLDELDQLETKTQSVLYTIFEWPSKANSKIILVGIANSLDLTDRILPRLQARCELKPKLMHFAPYTKPQIVQIFTERLKTAGVLEVFSPVALQMLAGKVAAVSGDVRRALDIGRRVIELVDQSKGQEVLKPLDNLASDLVDLELDSMESTTKVVELKQVINVLNNVYGTSQNLTEETDDTFPLQQKIILCSLVLLLNKAKNKDVTVGKLHEVYRKICTKRNLSAVDQAEFVGLCSLIETRGIIRVTGKKEPRLHKVHLEWDEEEVANALKDKQLMSSILQDISCLGKL